METTETKTENKSQLEIINSGVQQFETRRSELQAMKDEAALIKITGPDDKEGYEKARVCIAKLRENRVAIGKEGKAMRELLTPINKMIIEKEKELISIIEGEEDRLKKEKDAIDEVKEQAKAEKALKEKERITNRVKFLTENGASFDGITYRIGEAEIDFDNLPKLSDEEWTKLSSDFSAEKIKQDEIEAEKQRVIAQEKADFEKKQAELKEREDALKKQEEDAKKQKEKDRVSLITGLGFIIEDGKYKLRIANGWIDVPMEVFELDNEKWNAEIEGIHKKIAYLNGEKERIEKEKKEAAELLAEFNAKKENRIRRLISLGLNHNNETNELDYLGVDIADTLECFDMSDSQFEDFITTCSVAVSNQKKLDEENKRRDEEKKAADAKIETIFNERKARLITIGYEEKQLELDEVIMSLNKHDIIHSIPKTELVEMESGEFEHHCSQIAELIRKSKDEADMLQKAQKDAFLTDKELLEHYMGALASVPVPTLKTRQYQEAFETIRFSFMKNKGE